MKAIKSVYQGDHFLDLPDHDVPGETWLVVRQMDGAPGGAQRGIVVPTADLLAALGVDEIGCGCDEADSNLKKAQAERDSLRAELDEATATLAAVESAVEAWGNRGMPESVEEFKRVVPELFKDLRAALNPKPKLPTEPGSVILATEVRGVKGEWVAIFDEDNEWYTPGMDLVDHDTRWHRPEHITAWKPAKVVAE